MARDITGEVFGWLTVLRKTDQVYKHDQCFIWECACKCGNIKNVSRKRLFDGRIKSCGCYRKLIASMFLVTHGETVGGKETREYSTWAAMISRCYTRGDAGYARYGAVGITVCKRWRNSYETFLADMGRKPTPKHSIDRIDNARGYTPKNCRWATMKEQANNRRCCVSVRIGRESKNIAQWLEHYGISRKTYDARVNRGWDRARAISEPIHKICTPIRLAAHLE